MIQPPYRDLRNSKGVQGAAQEVEKTFNCIWSKKTKYMIVKTGAEKDEV